MSGSNDSDGELTRIPDPDFVRLPNDYGEDDSEGIKVYTYEGPSRPARPETVQRIHLISRYIAARDQMEGKSGVLGARRYEPEEIEQMRQELVRLGVLAIGGEDLKSGETICLSKQT